LITRAGAAATGGTETVGGRGAAAGKAGACRITAVGAGLVGAPLLVAAEKLGVMSNLGRPKPPPKPARNNSMLPAKTNPKVRRILSRKVRRAAPRKVKRKMRMKTRTIRRKRKRMKNPRRTTKGNRTRRRRSEWADDQGPPSKNALPTS